MGRRAGRDPGEEGEKGLMVFYVDPLVARPGCCVVDVGILFSCKACWHAGREEVAGRPGRGGGHSLVYFQVLLAVQPILED